MATVGKKFIDPDLWETPWFTELDHKEKYLYFYIISRCDHAGVIELVPAIWSVHMGIEITEKDVEKLVDKANNGKERIKFFSSKVWLTEYIRFQQKPDKHQPLSGTHGMTINIVRRLKSHGLYEEVKRRDPILLSEYEKKNGDTKQSKPSSSLSEVSPKGLSKSTSKGGSNGTSNSSDNLFNRVKRIWPKLELPEFVIDAELQRVEEFLDSENVKNPKAYILDRLDAIAESKEKISFEKFINGFTNESIDDVPF